MFVITGIRNAAKTYGEKSMTNLSIEMITKVRRKILKYYLIAKKFKTHLKTTVQTRPQKCNYIMYCTIGGFRTQLLCVSTTCHDLFEYSRRHGTSGQQQIESKCQVFVLLVGLQQVFIHG